MPAASPWQSSCPSGRATQHRPGVFGGAARGYEIAEADRDSEASRDVWFRIGELLSHVVRKVRQDHPERAGDVRDRGPQHVATPVETDVAPPKGREGRP